MFKVNTILKNLSADRDEAKFRDLGRMAGELKMILPQQFLTMEVLVGGKRVLIPDAQGRLKKVVHQRSRSWTRNAYNHMFSQLAAVCSSSYSYNDTTYAAGKISQKNTSAAIRYATSNNHGADTGSFAYSSGSGIGWNLPSGNIGGYLCAAASNAYGIVVGSGTNAESFEDYALQTIIANGTGAGQLSYIASELHAVSYDAGTKTFSDSLARYFNNNSGNSVDVNEVALYAVMYAPGQYGQDYICQSRDKLGSTITIPDTGQLKVTYTLSLVFPS